MSNDGEIVSEYLSLPRGASCLGISRRHVDRLVKRGKLPVFRLCGTGHPRVRRSDLDAIMVEEKSEIDAAVDGIIEDLNDG